MTGGQSNWGRGDIGLAAAAGLAMSLLVACTQTAPEPVSGRALYEDFCLACHGTAGLGDGPSAAGLSKPPADLTRIAARNGGEFSLIKVMSTIDGYTRRNDRGSVMPELGPQLQSGRIVLIDTGDGIESPVSEPLLALAEYLRTLQK